MTWIYAQTIEKIDMWDNDPQAPDIITDVSLTAQAAAAQSGNMPFKKETSL